MASMPTQDGVSGRWLSPPALLAWPGVGALAFWPGSWLSPGQLVVVISCLLPLGLTTLMRLEQGLTGPYVPPSPPAGASPGPPESPPC